jgi:hypothetical protein
LTAPCDEERVVWIGEGTHDVTVLIGHCVREREPDASVAGLPDGASVLVFVTRREPQSWRIAAATNVTESTPPPG